MAINFYASGKGKGKAKGTSKKTKGRKIPEPVKDYVHKQINRKLSWRQFLTASASQEITTTAVIMDITDIDIAAAGVADDPEAFRSQNEIYPQTITLAGYIVPKTTAVVDSVSRIIVFQWTGDCAADPPLATTLWGGAFTRPFTAPIGMDKINCTTPFKVLFDRTYHLGPQTGSASIPVANHEWSMVKHTINARHCKPVKYDSGIGDSGGRNHIYMLYIGNSGSGTNSANLYVDAFLQYKE